MYAGTSKGNNTMPIRRVSKPDMFKAGGEYDHTHSYLQGYNIDWSRMSAAQSRQSDKGADYTYLESRLYQEGVFETAVEMRPDHNPDMVLPLDEGAGVSGQKKIYQRAKLKTGWDYLINDLLGSWFSGREDRLFRDRHGTQSSTFTEECQKHNCILIIPGKRCYDFSRDDDLAVFKKKMDEAAAYLRHIRYMNDMQLRKQGRGEWIGNALIAPYAIDRVKQAKVKEYIKQQRLLGLRAGDIEFTEEMSQAYRPMIYQPWLERTLDLFDKIRLFNYEIPRLMRYVEEKPYLFPYPSGDDCLQYLFKITMKRVQGGYTFSSPERLRGWILNLNHIGWMIGGKDEESGEPIYLEDCFQGTIARDRFEETYIQLNGEDLDGNPVECIRRKARFTRAAPSGRTDALLLGLFKSDYLVSSLTGQGKEEKIWYYHCKTKRYQPGTPSEHTYLPTAIWTLPMLPFEQAIVERLSDLAEHDKELAERLRKYFAAQKGSNTTNRNLIIEDIQKLQKKYNHLQWLKTDESLGQTVQQIQEIVKEQQDIMHKIEVAQLELKKLDTQQPATAVPRFYDVLGDVAVEFWKQDLDHRRKMLRLLIKNIQVEILSPHVYALCVNWISPVAPRGDSALLYRGTCPRKYWSEEEKERLRVLYPRGKREDILRAYPDCSWYMIIDRAYSLGIKREVQEEGLLHKTLTFQDWAATCQYYEIDQESIEGEAMLALLNKQADQTHRGDLAFQWLIPANEITVRAMLEMTEGDMLVSLLETSKARQMW